MPIVRRTDAQGNVLYEAPSVRSRQGGNPDLTPLAVASTVPDEPVKPRRRRSDPNAANVASLPRAALVGGGAPAVPAGEEPQLSTESAKKPRRRGVAKKGADGKYLPTGDYPNGFAKAPEANRFPKGGPGGPGRPKGSRSQDSIKREKLNRKEPVTIDGKSKKVSRRELAEELLHKKAFEKGGNPKLLTQISVDATRLFPETANDNGAPNPFGDARMDAQVLRDLMAAFALGEPDPNVEGAFTLTPSVIADFAGASEAQGWDEGDWTAPGESDPDSDDDEPDDPDGEDSDD